MLRVHLFGEPRLYIDDTGIKFNAPPKTLPLLAYLLLHADRPILRETLAFALWLDGTEKDARANLRRHLHYLRRALPCADGSPPWFVSDVEALQWNPKSQLWLDVAEFQRLSVSPDSLAQAVDLYTGDLLEYLAEEEWLVPERERLRDLYLSDLSQLVLACRARRDHAQALAYAQRVVSHDPFREDTIRQIMALRYEVGDRAGALQEYERFIRRLHVELKVEPMPETVATYEAIIRNARLPSTLPEQAIALDDRPAATPQMLPFTGRDAEMESLQRMWRRAVQGRGGAVLIGGEAGIGKTRLAAELARTVESKGARVLWGNTTFAEPIPYQSIVEALRSALPLIAALQADPLWLSALMTLLPELKERRSPLPSLAALDPERERMRLFEALARCLGELAQPRPILLVLEDLHWAGEATIGALEALARHAARHSWLIAATFREEETGRSHPLRDLRRRLGQENLVEHLPLDRLAPPALAAIVEQVSDLTQRQALVDDSEGNPFFLVELIRDRAESGTGPVGKESSGIAPKGIREVIQARLARLSPSAQSTAQVAAVIGRAFDLDLVSQVSGWGEAEALDALGELLDRHLIREAGGRARSDYTFSHHLIQAAIYEAIPDAARRRRHRRVAQMLQELYPERLDDLASELALHLDRGGDTARAVDAYLRAARRALAVYADAEALASIARGLELDGSPRTRADLLALRESIHSRRGERAAQQQDLQELEPLAAELNDVDLQFDTLRRRVRLQRSLGERQAEAELIAQFAARASAAGSAHWQAEAGCEQAEHAILVGAYDRARDCVEKALPVFERLGDRAGHLRGQCLLADLAICQGDFAQAQALIEKIRPLAQAQGQSLLLVQVLRTASGAAFAKQDFATAGELGKEMLNMCAAIGDRAGEADAHTRLGTVATRLFQIQQAREHYARAEALYAALGKRQGQAAVLINAGMLANRLGHYARGRESFRKAEQLFQSLDDLRGQAVSALNLGIVAMFQEDWAAARDAAARGLELARAMKSQVMEANALANLGAAERECGDLVRAIEHMEAGLAIRRTLEQPAELGTDLCDLTLAYLKTGRLTAAQTATEEMLALYAHAGDTMMYPEYMLWVAAQTYAALGNKPKADELVIQAHAVLQDNAAAIPDLQSQTTFLQLPFHRDILAAFAPLFTSLDAS